MGVFGSRVILVLLMFLAFSVPAGAEQGMAIDPATCLGCHGDKISAAAYAASVHGKNACTSCHVDITDLVKHMKKEIKVQKVQCERCHKKQNAEHYASVHANKGVTCASCHTDIHTHNYWKNDKRIAVAKCVQCHDKEAVYQKSVHGKSVAGGNMDSAACHDCHNLHEIKALGPKGSHQEREFHTKVCMKCHSDEKMMARNKVFNVATKTYLESYHGKNYRLGFPEKVAGLGSIPGGGAEILAYDPTVDPVAAAALGEKAEAQRLWDRALYDDASAFAGALDTLLADGGDLRRAAVRVVRVVHGVRAAGRGRDAAGRRW